MVGADPYVVAGVDLRAFVADWVSDLESGGGQMRGMLEHAESDPQVGDRYEYGAHCYVVRHVNMLAKCCRVPRLFCSRNLISEG